MPHDDTIKSDEDILEKTLNPQALRDVQESIRQMESGESMTFASLEDLIRFCQKSS